MSAKQLAVGVDGREGSEHTSSIHNIPHHNPHTE